MSRIPIWKQAVGYAQEQEALKRRRAKADEAMQASRVHSQVEARAKEAAQKQAQEQQAAWDALPFYLKWWYSILDWLLTPAWWIIPRGVFVLAALVVVGAVYFGGRNVVRNLTAEPPAIEVPAAAGNPDLLGGGAQQSESGVGNPDLLNSGNEQQAAAPPLPASTASVAVVECTAQTCPDATPYRVDYQGEVGPKGSATLRDVPGGDKLGEVPKDTIVWVIRSTVKDGKFCEDPDGEIGPAPKECRIGQIKPIPGYDFAKNGGWLSFTALHPVNP